MAVVAGETCNANKSGVKLKVITGRAFPGHVRQFVLIVATDSAATGHLFEEHSIISKANCENRLLESFIANSVLHRNRDKVDWLLSPSYYVHGVGM